jgi:hypothetical protein
MGLRFMGASPRSREYTLPRSRGSKAAGSGGLFDHLVGAGKQRGRDGNSERFGCLEIDHQIELGRLLNRKVGWLCALENLVNVASGSAKIVNLIWPVGRRPPASANSLSPEIDGLTGIARLHRLRNDPKLAGVRQIIPRLQNVGVLLHPEPPNYGYLKSAEAAAPSFNIKAVSLPVQNSADIETGLATFAAEPNAGLIVAPNVVTFANSELIISLAARHRLPAIYPFAFYAKAGGLISYGFDAVAQFQQGAEYINKLLRGVKLSDLPVQHPTKFDVVVNLKTAKVLGLTIPESFLSLADEVIE